MAETLIIGIIVFVALALAVYFYCRSRTAETQSRQSSAMLNDLVAAEMMMKSSAMNSYKQMLRNPNPHPEQPPAEFPWEARSGNRRRF
jgi:hypothetical protein